MIKSVKKDSRKRTEFCLNNICPGGAFAVLCATLWRSSCRQRGQQSAGCRPEQCYYRLSLNQASIRIHRQRERCSGRGEREVNPKHPRAGANRRNAPKAKMVNQRLKDNLGQISERQYSGRKVSNCSKPAKRKGRRAWTFVLTKVQDRLPVINESPVCRVFKEKRRQIQCHHGELISFTFNQQILISENREMQMCHILYVKIKKNIWKLSFEYGRKDKAHPSPEIWTGVLKGWHNKVGGGRSFILIEIHESLCLTHV